MASRVGTRRCPARARPLAQRNGHTCRAGGGGDASAAGCMMASFDPCAPASERPGQEQHRLSTLVRHTRAFRLLLGVNTLCTLSQHGNRKCPRGCYTARSCSEAARTRLAGAPLLVAATRKQAPQPLAQLLLAAVSRAWDPWNHPIAACYHVAWRSIMETVLQCSRAFTMPSLAFSPKRSPAGCASTGGRC